MYVGSDGGQKKDVESLELELWAVVSCAGGGARNETQGPWKSSTSPYPLSHLASPQNLKIEN